jgi:hypothetical protein
LGNARYRFPVPRIVNTYKAQHGSDVVEQVHERSVEMNVVDKQEPDIRGGDFGVYNTLRVCITPT